MQITFVFIFYIMLNLAPANVDQFQVEAQEPDSNEKITLYFVRQAKEWKVTTNTGKKESAFLRLDGSDFYLREGEGDNKKAEKIDLLNRMDIETDHKKWRKATKVTFKAKEKEDGEPDKRSLVFYIKKEGKKKRTIEVDRANNPEFGKNMPTLYMSWN